MSGIVERLRARVRLEHVPGRGDPNETPDSLCYEAASTIEALQARVRELEEALRNINTGHCERCTSGIGSCFQYGYTVDARYTDDKVCDSCIADRALGTPS